MKEKSGIGVLGGTFDPIHYGHLRPALEVMEALELAEIRFIPCQIPAHRGLPTFNAAQRLALVQRAIADQAGFIADDRELRREGISYMWDTLASLRTEIGAETPLCLLLGADAFRDLPSWYRWRELSDLAHIVIMQRPGAPDLLPSELEAFGAPRRVPNAATLQQAPAGGFLWQPVTQLAISATQIRARLAAGQSVRYLMPEAVVASLQC